MTLSVEPSDFGACDLTSDLKRKLKEGLRGALGGTVGAFHNE